MLEPVKIASWGFIVCMSDRELAGNAMGSLNNFISALHSNFSQLGMAVPQRPTVQFAADMGRYPDPHKFCDAVEQLLRAAGGKAPDIVFVIKPKRGARSCVVAACRVPSRPSACWLRCCQYNDDSAHARARIGFVIKHKRSLCM